MKKILYLANLRMPTEKAYGYQIAKMCEAFAGQSNNLQINTNVTSEIEVELVAPYRKKLIRQNFFDFYRVRKNFKFKVLPAIDFYLPSFLNQPLVILKEFFSAVITSLYALTQKADLVYSRDEFPIYLLSFFRRGITFEAHKFSRRKSIFYNRFKKAGMKIVVISGGLRDEFVKIGFPADRIMVAHDGVDLDEFVGIKTKEACRQQLNLPLDKKIIGYVGHLRTMGMEKGINVLMGAFGKLKNSHPNIALVVVGGAKADIEYYRRLANMGDVLFIERVDRKLVPYYLKSFDIVAMPFPYNTHYAHYMSPLKLFEYMASKRPIVTTDLPTIREVVNDESAIFVKPGDADSLAGGIEKLLNDPELGNQLTGKAFELVKNYTWSKRADKILDFVFWGQGRP